MNVNGWCLKKTDLMICTIFVEHVTKHQYYEPVHDMFDASHPMIAMMIKLKMGTC